MKSTETDASGALGHQQTWELIPWLVTGTLDEAEAGRVEAHLTVCPICRQEEKTSRQLAEAIRSEAAREPAPAAERSLGELMVRIDRTEEADRAAASARRHAPGEAVRAPGAHRREEGGGWLVRLAAALAATPAGMQLALAGQLAVILLLAGFLLGRRPAAPPALFHTLSEPRSEAAARPGRLQLRVVFADGVRLGDVNRLLYGLGAEIVGGPSPTGVYTVEVGARGAIEQSVLERLRAHAEVVFAEPVSPPPSAAGER